jgi:drug/metabolite transporter (DMT)-like permease
VKTKNNRTPLGAGFVTASSLLYGFYGVWIVLIGNFVGVFMLGVLRGLIVVIVLLPIALWKKQLVRLDIKNNIWPLIGLIFTSLCIGAPLYYAVNIIGVGIGVGVAYAGILIGAFIFGAIFGGEKYTKEKIISTFLGMAGLALVFLPSAETFGFLALLAALLSGLASGFNMVINKNIKYNVTQTTIVNWSTSVVVNLPIVFILHETIPTLSTDVHWFYVLGFGITSLCSSWLVFSGLRLIDAGTAGILGMSEIVFGIILGMILFNEKLKLIVALGMVFILLAAALPYLTHYKATKSTIKQN